MITEFEKRVLSSLILIPISIFFIIQGAQFFVFFLCIIFFFTSYEWFSINKRNIFLKIIGIIFLFFSFYAAYLLRMEKGYLLFLFVILITILSDVGGYTFGKTFKGPKLTKISPNKTYSGVIGSFVLSLVGGMVYAKLALGTLLSAKSYFLFLIFIFIISLLSQLGDLTISYFKRLAKVKNTGKILPGHGGLLDRIDGIIFVVPFSYIIFKVMIY